MSDVPEHLIEAAYKAWDKSETGAIYDPGIIAAILAALRPEDAHLIRPALARLAAERDEARAEVERLREQYEPVESAAAVSLPGTRGER